MGSFLPNHNNIHWNVRHFQFNSFILYWHATITRKRQTSLFFDIFSPFPHFNCRTTNFKTIELSGIRHQAGPYTPLIYFLVMYTQSSSICPHYVLLLLTYSTWKFREKRNQRFGLDYLRYAEDTHICLFSLWRWWESSTSDWSFDGLVVRPAVQTRQDGVGFNRKPNPEFTVHCVLDGLHFGWSVTVGFPLLF